MAYCWQEKQRQKSKREATTETLHKVRECWKERLPNKTSRTSIFEKRRQSHEVKETVWASVFAELFESGNCTEVWWERKHKRRCEDEKPPHNPRRWHYIVTTADNVALVPCRTDHKGCNYRHKMKTRK